MALKTVYVLTILICIIGNQAVIGQTVDELISAAESYSKAKNYDSALLVGQDAFALARDSGADDSVKALTIYNLGKYQYMKGEYIEAESLFVLSLEMRTNFLGAKHLNVAFSKVGLANVYNVRGMNDKAGPLYREALETTIELQGRENLRVAGYISLYARHLKNKGDFVQSTRYYRESLEIKEKLIGPDSPELFSILCDLALILTHQKLFGEAEIYYIRAMNNVVNAYGRVHIKHLRVINMMANLYGKSGRYAASDSLLEKAHDLAVEIFGADHPRVAAVLSHLGESNINLGNYRKAENYLVKSVAVFERTGDTASHDFAQSILALADLYFVLGRYTEAEPLYKRSVHLIEKAFWFWKDTDYLTKAFIKLGNIYNYQGRYREADIILNTALDLRAKRMGEGHQFLVEIMLGLSSSYENQGRFEEAEEICGEAIEIYEKMIEGKVKSKAECYLRMADLYKNQLRYDDAEKMYLRALDVIVAALGDRHQDVILTLARLGEVNMGMGNYSNAENFLNEAIERGFADNDRDNPHLAEIHRLLGQLHQRLDRPGDAESHLLATLQIFDKIYPATHPDLAAAAMELGRFYARNKDWDAAVLYYGRFLESRRQFLNTVFASSSENQKLFWIQKYPPIDNSLLTLALNSGHKGLVELALNMVLTGKSSVADAMYMENRTGYCAEDEISRTLLDQRNELSTSIANLALAGIFGSTGDTYRDSLQILDYIRDSIETELSRRCSEFNEDAISGDISIENVCGAIDDDAVLWEILSYTPFDFQAFKSSLTDDSQKRYLTFTLDYSGSIGIADLGNAGKIDSMILLARDMIYNAAAGVLTGLGEELEYRLSTVTSTLRKKLFAPAASSLDGIDRIVIAPDGDISLLPFDILPDDNGVYAVEKFRISYLSSGRDLVRYRGHDDSDDGNAVFLSDPDFDLDQTKTRFTAAIPDLEANIDSGILSILNTSIRSAPTCLSQPFPRLAQTREEAKIISAMVDSKGLHRTIILSGPDATETAIKTMELPPAIIHIATHGYVCDYWRGDGAFANPMLHSGLVLAGANTAMNMPVSNLSLDDDGFLTAMEVSGLNLSSTELVTLSTCESGLGKVFDGEVVFGLRRSFHNAGARSMLMSLWKVYDMETSELMIGFYHRWLGGLGKSEALRSTMLDLLDKSRKTGGHGHPITWGGFVLTGAPD